MTEEQTAVVMTEGSTAVSACPGAGKTRALVERFVRVTKALPQNRGVAVLSFTNVAVNEVESRCTSDGNLKASEWPSFVGTFDSFVGRFLVVPFPLPDVQARPKLIESWKHLGITVQIRGVRSPGLSLDVLRVNADGTALLDGARVPRRMHAEVEKNRSRWEGEARRRRLLLLKAGYLTCEDARTLAVRRIRDPAHGKRIGKILSLRFEEIIVDELQDCGPLELEILEWLQESGIRIVTLCDPDQGIYEFRDASQVSLAAYLARQAPLRLTGNFRCSPSICSFSATLRRNSQADTSIRADSKDCPPVALIIYDAKTPELAGKRFIELTNELGLRESPIALAHSGKLACRMAALPLPSSGGTTNVEGLIASVSTIRCGASEAVARVRAIETIERLVLDMVGMDRFDLAEEFVAQSGRIDLAWLRRAAFTWLLAIPESAGMTFEQWVQATREASKAIVFPAGLKQSKSAGVLLRTPKNMKGKPMPDLASPSDGSQAAIRASSVHQAKGKEFEAVLVAIPKQHKTNAPTLELLADWKARSDSEAKRVIYVAATRAKRLLGIAVPKQHAEAVEEICLAGSVPFARYTAF